MEKREFIRQSTSINAMLQIGGAKRFSCTISDFSQGGMLVLLNDARAPEVIGVMLKSTAQMASVSFQLAGRTVSMDVSAAHRSGNAMGLRLVSQDPKYLTWMQQASSLVRSASTDAMRRATADQPSLTPARKLNLAKTANSELSDFLDDQLSAFFAALDRNLLAEADIQKNQAAQQPFFDALRLFRKHHRSVLDRTVARLCADATDVAAGKFQESPDDTSGRPALALVDKNEFEDWLVVRVAVSKSEMALRETLIELQLRLDAAFGNRSAARVFNPYSPAALCGAFADSIKHLRLASTVQSVVFRTLHDCVLINLDRIYATLNGLFIDADILPDIDVTLYLAAQAQQKLTEQNRELLQAQTALEKAHIPSSGAEPVTDAAELGKTHQPAHSAASRLLSLQRHAEQGDIRSAGFSEPGAPSEAVLEALRNVQKDLLDGGTLSSSSGSLRKRLAELSGSAQPLSEHEQDSADMIENLFDNIVHNDRVETDLRDELRKLEVPLLQVMLQDPALFAAEFHPARQAINYLALLADRHSLHAGANKKAVIEAISTILRSDDGEGFSQALAGLDSLVNREKRYIERNLARLTEACEGQQRLRQVERRIEQELTERLSQTPVPTPVIELVEAGWKQLMRLSLLREGAESRSWEMTLNVIDQLLARSPGARPSLLRLIDKPDLLKLIRIGLSKVGDTDTHREELIARLELLLYAKNPDVAFTTYRSQLVDTEANETELFADDPTMQRWLKRARSLEQGQWLQSQSSDTAPQLWQLAWIAESYAKLVFGNHHGVKVADLTLVEVAEQLRDGQLVVLNDANLPAVEQGLDALLQKVYDKLAFDSAHDQLTGLRTRKEFTRCLAQTVADARQNRSSHALIFIDIVQFKVINNTCGYEAGDRFLSDLAQRIRNFLEDDAVVGRIGADEFAVLVPLAADKAGYLLATDLKRMIEERRFEHAGQSFVINAVVALVGFDQHNDHVLELLRAVEAAAEICKKSGHTDVQLVHPGDHELEERDEVMSWVTRINQALDENKLRIRCQKIMPIGPGAGDLLHYEVLLTVVDDTGEHVPPAEFIKAAEEYNRMGSVDRWVIQAVLAWMTEHLSQLKHFGGFSINLSGHSLNDESFLDFIFEALVRYQIPRDKLIFEITETTAVANLEDAADFINEMRNIGCRFSLDDFGAGQSSYAYLKRLPVDFIKIDGAFIKHIAEDDIDFALVRSITEMGHFLNKKVIAEYVSSAEILKVITDIGVDYAQGFHFGEQVMIEDLVLEPDPAA